ncbi:uncharacterized protein BHQ10_003039 [Talaromyces amestolkiae]|uniref:SWR1-complex protein 3 domain-containing protein n=1 Tax=Talaromyces amestolkiae TaxID=1196081 RepID=A0A364KTZ3_TALAM|nr:uncharacterized protein BHQ10_003039 [Talaromyces amestolkiae]RAO67027.1 hypothetical protein BHQ10_003039 [Talaromyces amestolkiae]
MAEKRKLPARERREPAAKRRVSEAISESSSRRKKSTPALTQASTPVAKPTPERQATPEPIEEPLPTKVKEADPLPTRIKAQPSLTLSDKEYQSFAESAILSISLDRSKKKWLSDGIFERYWTKPKKTKREQLEGKNPPKDSMTKIGACKIIIEPHHFDGMIYTVKDPNAKPTVQITAPQRHIIHYGPPPPQAGYQYQHYAPPQQMRPPPYPYQTPNTQHVPPRAPQPPQSVSRQPPVQAQGPPPQPAKPSPDPVIQMLATRAASDPELKALMRIVASSKATQEQLRIFQGHIDELNAIIRQRERQQQQYYQQNPQAPRPQSAQPQNSPPAAPLTPQQAQKPPQQSQTVSTQSTPAPAPSSTPKSPSTPVPISNTVKPEAPSQSGAQATSQANSTKQESQSQPAPSTAQSSNTNIDTPTPNDTPNIKTEPEMSTTAAAAPTPPPAASAPPTPTPPVQPPTVAPISTPAAPSPAPYNAPKVSPAPGYASANPSPQPLSPYPPGPSQHSPYHTPYYPTGPPPIKARGAPPNYGPSNTYYQSVPAPPAPKPPIKAVVFEFTSPLTPYGSSTSGHAGSGDRYLFPEYTILEYQAGGTVLLASFLLVRKVDPNTKFPLELAADAAPKTKSKASKSKKKDKGKAADESGPSTPAPDNEASAAGALTDEKKQPETNGTKEETPTTTNVQPKKEEPSNLKEYYQPITMRFYSSKPATLEPLSRIVKPAAEVRKYMEEIMERAERAPAGFLPFRLPREKPLEIVDEADASAAVAAEDAKSKSRDESLAIATPRDGEDGGDAAAVEDVGQEDLEFLLKDYYDAPSGLVPIRA